MLREAGSGVFRRRAISTIHCSRSHIIRGLMSVPMSWASPRSPALFLACSHSAGPGRSSNSTHLHECCNIVFLSPATPATNSPVALYQYLAHPRSPQTLVENPVPNHTYAPLYWLFGVFLFICYLVVSCI